jgi:phage terminase large subunit-like protein
MLLRPLLQIHDPKFEAIFFRRTGAMLTGSGSVWNEAKSIYRNFGAKIKENAREIHFPSGAQIKFSHMEHEKNADDHQGKQYSQIYFDEGTAFTQYQITFLMSRLRSSAEVKSTMFISCNPDPDSYIAQLIDWWLDDEGFPDKSKAGVQKFYGMINDELYFTDTVKEMEELHPTICWVNNPNTGEKEYFPPKTITFIGGTIFDNAAVRLANPGYVSQLNALPQIEKDRLLHGNWYARPEGSSHFQRSWLTVVDTVPEGAAYCRAWDKAATEPSEKNTHPDYTASVKMAKDRHGFFYLIGDYESDNYDKKDCKQNKVFGRFRERSGRREVLVHKQAEQDGTECTVILSQDPGAAGITEYTDSARKLITLGYVVKKDPMPTTSGKLTRYLPFSSAAENGLVYLVKSSFNPATLDAFFKESEAFDGERSSSHRKDDWPDATASAFNYLSTARIVRIVPRNQSHTRTLAADIVGSVDQVKVSDLEPRGANLPSVKSL